MNEQYTRKLESVIKQMLCPLRGIPLKLVIESISEHKIIPFDKNDSRDPQVLNNLKKVAKMAGNAVNKSGIFQKRPNEVGNDIEPFVKDALNKIGYKASTPLSQSGNAKSAGYPDIEFLDEFNRANYLECKTFNIKNIGTTQRSFYLSPSHEFKITKDAHHFMISFEVFVKKPKGNKQLYNCKSWKILTLENLEVDIKYEFNSDNVRMYTGETILAEGIL
jgi:hypothetical protein